MGSNESLVARRQAAVARGVSMVHAVFIERAENALLWDGDGRRYIDFAGGIAVQNSGHAHRRALEAVRAQLDKVTHTCFQITPYELCRSLRKLNLSRRARSRHDGMMSTGARRSIRGQDRSHRTGRSGYAFSAAFTADFDGA